MCALDLLQIRKMGDGGGFSMTCVSGTHRRLKKSPECPAGLIFAAAADL